MQYSSYYEGSTAAIHAKHALFDHFSIFLLLSSSSFYIKICMKHDTKFLHIMSFSRQEMIRGRGVRSVYFTTGSYFITGSSLVSQKLGLGFLLMKRRDPGTDHTAALNTVL